MKNKLETRTHKHIQVKIVRPWIMDYRKIIPTVFEIQTCIYKFMWRKKINAITKSYIFQNDLIFL